MAHIHWGSIEHDSTVSCKNCGNFYIQHESQKNTTPPILQAIERFKNNSFCLNCVKTEERERKINMLLKNKKWWQIWKK